MKKKVIISIVIILILIVVVIVGCIFLNQNNTKIDNTIIDEKGTKYANNIIVVFLNANVSESTYEQISKEMNGNIISFSSISARIQLNDIKFTSYDEILQYCQQVISQYEGVKYAMPEMIVTTGVN